VQTPLQNYRALPKFYVIVVFQEVAPESFYMGGEPTHNFVRIWVDPLSADFVAKVGCI
jgi:Putative oxalocrotonate tautomerase enzyme